LVAILVALPLGTLAALKRNTIFDALASIGAVAGLAMPSFWLGVLLILLFSLALRWLPPSGFKPLLQDPVGNLTLMILPTLTVGAVLVAILTRIVRSSLLEVLDQDYVRTARAKGVAELLIMLRHAFKNALIPVVTVAGLQVGRLMVGAVIAETI